jgi:hypothetical protein
VFCAVEPLGIQRAAPRSCELFVWAWCQEFVRSNGAIEEASGASFPCALTLTRRDGAWLVTGEKVPGDGAYYAPEVRVMFPPAVRDRILARNVDFAALDRRARAEVEHTSF